MKFQMFGTLESDGAQREVMLCRDFDRPNEAMLHVYGSEAERPPYAVLVLVNETSNGELELIPSLVYRPLENGSLVISNNQADIKQATEHRATLRQVGDNLEGNWTNISGESGKIILSPPDMSLSLDVETCDSWNDFKVLASSIRTDNKTELFRGHRDSRFVLKTSFHRAGLHRLERYCSETLVEFCGHVESILNVHIDLNNSNDYSMLFGLAQHHGLPTPLLDWTRSPYIAAFFAFSDALEAMHLKQGATHVRIYCLSRDFVALRPSVVSVPYFRPYICPLMISPRGNTRLYNQQGQFLVTNVAELESHILRAAKLSNRQLLSAVDIPIECATDALEDLYFMGVTAGSLFPGLDGVCRMMKYQMQFRRQPTTAVSKPAPAPSPSEQAPTQTSAAEDELSPQETDSADADT